MIEVIEEEDKSFVTRCNHCGKKLKFNFSDIWSSYCRGQHMSEGWIDGDCLWHYINCPNCNGIVSVNSCISNDEESVDLEIILKMKYDGKIVDDYIEERYKDKFDYEEN